MMTPLTTSPLSGNSIRWSIRDSVAALALFAATAFVILWQNSHVAVLWDIAYTLDSAARIAAGQLPYRDFPFAHAPLAFLIQAAIIRLTGRVFWHHVAYAAILGGLGSILAWRMVLHTLHGRITNAWTLALLLAAPLTVLGLYCIIPHPSYDCDCAFSMLVALWLLQRLESPAYAISNPARGLATGAALCLPLFFKQNIGLPFLAVSLSVVGIILAARLISRGRPIVPAAPDLRALWAVLAGALTTLVIAAVTLQLTVGINRYLYWTITFARQRRLPPWGAMLQIYSDPNLLWTIPCIGIGLLLLRSRTNLPQWKSSAALALLAAPFVFALCSLLVYDDADERGDSLLALWPMLLILAAVLASRNLFHHRRNLTLRALMPIILLAAINGTFLSQQLWGSTYAIWPLLLLLVAELIAWLVEFSPRWLPTALTACIATTLLVCGAFYTASEERLSYADLPDGPAIHSVNPHLAGMAIAGPWLPEFDELLHYAAAQIPFNDSLILLPGEDPFYFATGRTPQFPQLLFDPATDPWSPQQIAELAKAQNVRWLIVKRHLQIKESPMPQPETTLKLLEAQFTLQSRLAAYDIYRRP